MAVNTVKKYKLYATANLQPPKGIKYSFVPTTLSHMLIYTDKRLLKKDGYIPIDERLIDEGKFKLLQEERTWLAGVKLNINTQYVQQNKQDIIEFINALFDEVEKNLAALQESRQTQSDNKDRDTENGKRNSQNN